MKRRDFLGAMVATASGLLIPDWGQRVFPMCPRVIAPQWEYWDGRLWIPFPGKTPPDSLHAWLTGGGDPFMRAASNFAGWRTARINDP